MVAEPKYKYGQQEQVTVRNHNRSTALELGGFCIEYDASSSGLSAVLYKVQVKVISYASRGLRNSARHCPACKLKILCLKWLVTEKIFAYLYGDQFDNNPLTYVLSSAKLVRQGIGGWLL